MAIEFDLPQDELNFTYVRSSGAGGQNVNKVNSKAVLRWNALETRALPEDVKNRFVRRYKSKLTAEGDLVLMSDRFRDQGRNASDCIEKLKALIQTVATPPKKRKPTKPTYGSKMRRLKSKKEQSEKKRNRRYRGDS